jgi:hypothetical protein
MALGPLGSIADSYLAALRFCANAARSAALVALAALCCVVSCAESPAGDGSPVVVAVAHARVEQTVRRTATALVTVRTDAGTLTTTPDHLFAKLGAGWTPAGRLSVGDRILSRNSPSGARILSLEKRAVQPTQVFNLTIAKTHSYLVGPEGLLVHNVDCGGRPTLNELLEQERGEKHDRTLGAHLDRERALERQQQEAREKLADLREKHRAWLDDRRRTFNDMNSNRNCSYCSLGGLSDFDKVTAFVRDHDLDGNTPPNGYRVRELMQELGLRSANSPPEAVFKADAGRKRSKTSDPQLEADKFMKESSANTFFVSISTKTSRGIGEGHALLAVRQVDGSITYVDLQQVPPVIYDKLNPRIDHVFVTPTDVDWRFNRKLFDVVENSPRARPQQAWPDTAVIPLPKKLPRLRR